MDQDPLLFVASEDSLCIIHNNNNIHNSCPNKSLRKSQAAIDMFVNVGKGDIRDGYTALIYKSNRSGRSKAIEKLAWDTKVPILFRKMPSLA